MKLSSHAERRMQQRGFRVDDLEVILKCGTQLDSESYLLLDKDITREIGQLEEKRRRLERLRGCKLILRANTVITCYHAEPKHQKKAMRHRN